MNSSNNGTLCGFCLSIISDKDFMVIEDYIKEVLDVLLLKPRSKGSSKSVMCNTCSTKLFAAFNFKATCMDTEDCIFPYIHSKKGVPVDLREVYVTERGKEDLIDVLEEERICRLCMQVIICHFSSIDEVDVDMLGRYIPEINFSSTKDPVVCKICLDALYLHTNFLRYCTYVEVKMEDISEDKAAISECLVIEEGELKYEEEYSDMPEHVSETNHSTHQHTENKNRWDFSEKQIYGQNSNAFDYKAVQRKSLTRHQLEGKDIPKEQLFKCDSCNYKTIYKRYLWQHQQMHTARTYECNSCNYKTNQKRCLKLHRVRHKIIPKHQMYKCDSCDYKARRCHQLARHKLKHKNVTEDHMYKCDSCDYKTIYKDLLNTHLLRHKVIREEEMLKCDGCDFRTTRESYLRRHKLKHVFAKQTYQCVDCDYKTTRKKYFERHRLKHEDIPKEQMYECYSCDYKTPYKCLISRHQLNHRVIVAKRVYKCDSCDYTTLQKKRCRQHRLGHETNLNGQV